jgi:putative DNA methylase
VYASDLSPVACMLTWGALNIVGGSTENRDKLGEEQQTLVRRVQEEIDRLGVETDGKGWRAKVFLYCVETRCPQTGWLVPLLPTRVVSKGYRTVAELVPDPVNKRYDIQIRTGASDADIEAAETGTVVREGKYDEASLLHQVDGVDYKIKISTLRGDSELSNGPISNNVRQWEKVDFVPRPRDLLQERLYCIQWMRPKKNRKGMEYVFRSVTEDDLRKECIVENYVAERLVDWQNKGWVPEMRIEVGGPPRYQGLDLIRSRGWTHWHHVFNPRQLMIGALLNQERSVYLKFGLTQVLNCNSRLSRWNNSGGGGGIVKGVFDNQALNTLFNYGCRGVRYALDLLEGEYKHFPLSCCVQTGIDCLSVNQATPRSDICVTDPPYGDAVKYEEILDFFIAWLRKSPPHEFAGWVWDSRRELAIQGEDEDFRRNMVAAYKRMTECMPDNGIQVIMFTHQSGSIWADMANIVWASGLRVTAAWYVATETDSALREGSHVKGTVLLVLRKRQGTHKSSRSDLAWEIQDEVEAQVQALSGLNQQAKGLYRDENVFQDADIQMAGYAAALRVLTRYAVIDGRDMTVEAIRPRVKGETTIVDDLIAFAVTTANQCLVPQGLARAHWDKLNGAERFYLKMLDMESRGAKALDNYQNFAKAFKVRDFKPLLASQKANDARLKGAVELGRAEMSEGSELYQSVLRAVLYAMMELVKNVDSNEVLAHLTLNIPNYYAGMAQPALAIELADYLAGRLEALRPEEARTARILRELVKNQRLG